jgi:starch synthase (maltosyl-transferring)
VGFTHALFDGDGLDMARVDAAHARNLHAIVAVDFGVLPIQHALVERHPDWFTLRIDAATQAIDPREHNDPAGMAVVRPDVAGEAFVAWCRTQIDRYRHAGVDGFLLQRPERLSHDILRALDGTVIADTTGLSRRQAALLEGGGLAGCLSSLPWWDHRASWLVEEFAALSAIAPVIAPIGLPGRMPTTAGATSLLPVAALAGDGVLIPASLLTGNAAIDTEVECLNTFLRSQPIRSDARLRNLTGPGAPLTILRRGEYMALANPDGALLDVDSAFVRQALGEWEIDPRHSIWGQEEGLLHPLEARLYRATRRQPVRTARREDDRDVKDAASSGRVAIENIAPTVDGGQFAVKRLAGERVTVEADIFADGHSVVAAALVVKSGADRDEIALALVENDRWSCTLPLDRIGIVSCTIEAWIDVYGTFTRDLRRKSEAGYDVTSELADGRTLVENAAKRAKRSFRTSLKGLASGLATLAPDQQVAMLLAPEAVEAMRRIDERKFRSRSAPLAFSVDRKQAMFASWYEVFPRSLGHGRHGTFDDVIARLPAIAAMGFDVLYLPPIHPIGETNRKGRNNALRAGGGDPGSVYAVGSGEGGHDAIHSELGSFDDFRRLIEAAQQQGLEIALDFAVQCSPDHPWLREHPGWFDWQADGSIKYAENPPKKYEDIVNVDFYAADAVPGLWLALRDIVRFWIGHGVRTFRVDNPHTKPFAFWQWLIADIRSEHPEIIFLAEAFTRPKVMYRLAKLGFTQSYSYFTWRNTKDELETYLTALNTAPVSDFFRPHFFANTPDINPFFLQSSGRAGFLIRAALAATLSGLWGIFSGFELCEAAALPGREEYADSDKYEVKPRNWAMPGNIIVEITQLNRLRRAEPALQNHLGLSFYRAFNPNILYFAKKAPFENSRILVAISLNPHGAEEADFEAPLWEWGLSDDRALAVTDLLSGAQSVWRGKRQHIRLTPDAPYRIWRALPAMEG